ncbi:hypothetical protein ACJ72_06865, partial [Emergomyces africanus]
IASPSLKRRLDTSDLSDTENVDPSAVKTPSAKRTRNSLDEDVCKPAATATTKYTFASPKPTITTKNVKPLQTPRSQINRAPLPNSAPLRAPAGRSPKSKPAKAFSRRSIGSYTRVDPPSFTKSHAAPRAPFSIADALRGTLRSINNGVPKTQSQSQPPRTQTTKISPLDLDINIISGSSSSSSKRHLKAWDFEIYTDTEQDEMANMMEHSTCVLDISDDEDKPRDKDDRGKENIPPPAEFGGQRAMDGERQRALAGAAVDGTSRNVEMTDGPRSALGELDVSLFVSVSEEADDDDDDDDDDEEENNPQNENEHASEHAPNTADSTATIPLPPATAAHGEDFQPQSQEQIKPVAASESETEEIITSSSPSQSRPAPSSDDPYHFYHTLHTYHQYQYGQQRQKSQALTHTETKPSKPTLSSHAAISALISSTAPAANTTSVIATTASLSPSLSPSPSPSLPTSIEIDIWESGSAADEAEAMISV